MSILKIAFALAAPVALLAASQPNQDSPAVVTHEWGTFTSVADENGAAVEWAPLLGPGDLPCFVTRAHGPYKSIMRGLVRMETPVLYFYAQRPATLSVHVDFPAGVLSEWYPNPVAPQLAGQGINWSPVQVTPGPDLEYPSTQGASHYYAARHTDSSPLRIGTEQEKMIFYRGLGSFTPPLRARYESDGKVRIENAGPAPIPFVIAFENHNGSIGFRTAENLTGSITLDAPETTGDPEAIQDTLRARLTQLGLYPKEAAAMVETWADSWFSEGARVFYLVPRVTVDSLLPLQISPAPTEIQRVFVGRVEVLSPNTRDTLKRALRAGDETTLTNFGRFLEPFAAQIQRVDKEFVLSPAAQAYLRAIATGSPVGSGYGPAPDPASCIE